MPHTRLIDQLMPLAPAEVRSGDPEGTLRFVNELLESTLDAVAAHIAILDERGTVIAVNRAWKRFAEENGASAGGYGIGMNYVEICRAAAGESASGASDVADGLVDVLSGRREQFYLRYPCHAPRENRWFQIRVNRFEVGGVRRVVVAHENITETKQFEERILLEHVNFSHAVRLASLGELAAGIAHELNQPLAAIANYANGCLRRLRAGGDRESVIEGVQKIADQALRAGEIIRRIRSFARRGDPPSTSVSVREVVDRVVELCQPEAARARVRIEARIPAGTPDLTVDPIQLEQVLANLIRNSIEAMAGAGSARRVVTVRALAEGSRALRIEVADTGPGIDTVIRGRLFEPFSTTKPNGMGLGLSLSESMVAGMGGKLELGETGSEGSVFVIRVPVSAHGSMRMPTFPSAGQGSGGSGGGAGEPPWRGAGGSVSGRVLDGPAG